MYFFILSIPPRTFNPRRISKFYILLLFRHGIQRLVLPDNPKIIAKSFSSHRPNLQAGSALALKAHCFQNIGRVSVFVGIHPEHREIGVTMISLSVSPPYFPRLSGGVPTKRTS
jgi:hypothetical protein